MVFENMGTWGMAWGYLFVVVIAGASLFVGLKKRQMRDAKRLKEKLASDVKTTTETKPDLEQVEEKKTDVKKTDEKKSAFAESSEDKSEDKELT